MSQVPNWTSALSRQLPATSCKNPRVTRASTRCLSSNGLPELCACNRHTKLLGKP
jgi:hypothetical protein